VSLPVKNRFDPSYDVTEKGDKPSQLFRDYMTKLDALVTAMAAGNLPILNLSTFVVAADDAAAAAAGVPIGGIYRGTTTGVAPHTVSVLQVRVS
jgi:hypothetical protein